MAKAKKRKAGKIKARKHSRRASKKSKASKVRKLIKLFLARKKGGAGKKTGKKKK